MCAKPRPPDLVLPVNRLLTEFDTHATDLGGPYFRPAWAGVTVYTGILESA